MILMKNTQRVLDSLMDGPKSLNEIIQLTEVKDHKVKNILMELTDGGLVRRSVDGQYRVVDRVPAPKHDVNPNHEVNEWNEHHKMIIPKLKNLSRIV